MRGPIGARRDDWGSEAGPTITGNGNRYLCVSEKSDTRRTNLQTMCYRIRGVPLVVQIIPGSEGCPAADWVRIMERQNPILNMQESANPKPFSPELKLIYKGLSGSGLL